MKPGTLALSWGSGGGVYVHWGFCRRLCIGPVALTYCPVEIDDLMEAYAAPKAGETPEEKR